MGRHCGTCTCAPDPIIHNTAELAWLLHYGDGVPIDEAMADGLGVMLYWLPLKVSKIDGCILRTMATMDRSAKLSERFERLRAANCFGGLRANGTPFKFPAEFEREGALRR